VDHEGRKSRGARGFKRDAEAVSPQLDRGEQVIVVDENHVVDNGHSGNGLRHGIVDGDAFGDGVSTLGAHRPAGLPAELHARRSRGAHADDTDLRCVSLHPGPDSADQSTVTYRDDDRVDRMAKQLDPDRASAFGYRRFTAILDQIATRMPLGHRTRLGLHRITSSGGDNHLRSQQLEPVALRRVDPRRDDHGDAYATAPPGVRDGLTEVSCRRADHVGGASPVRVESVHQELATAALETAQRVGRLDLGQHRPPERMGKRRVDELRAVEEHIVDYRRRPGDPRRVQIGCHHRHFGHPSSRVLLKTVSPGAGFEVESSPALAQCCCVPKRLELDQIDHRLLDELQRDASRPLRALGEEIGLSASAVQRRIARYRSAGILSRLVAVLDLRRNKDIVLAIVLVTLERESSGHHEAFRQRLLATPEVQQAYVVTGDWDYAVVLATRGMARQHVLADRLFNNAPNVKRYTTMVVLDPIRTGNYLPTR
jgi:Lrp/AsnC family leucine-responsive transcriptional regulator